MKKQKKDVRALAYEHAQEVAAKTKDLLDGVDPPHEVAEIRADDPAEQEILHALNCITAWAANLTYPPTNDLNKADTMLNMAIQLFENPRENTADIIKNVKNAARDFVGCCCALMQNNKLLEAVGEHYGIENNLRLFYTPEENLQKRAEAIEERAKDLPGKELNGVLWLFTRKATEPPKIEQGISRVYEIMAQWGADPALFDFDALESVAFTPDEYERRRSRRTNQALVLLDKISKDITPFFDQLATKGSNKKYPGQLTLFNFPVDVRLKGSAEAINVIYSQSRDITPYERKIERAVAELMIESGQNTFTLNQIYHAMGNRSNINPRIEENMLAALHNLRHTDIFIDNYQEHTTYGKAFVKYDGAAVSWQRANAYINGKFSDVIKFDHVPPRVRFGVDRYQYTKFPLEAWATPVRLTDMNMAIEEYLLQRIGTMRSKKQRIKNILLPTIYDHVKADTKAKRHRAAEAIGKFIKHFSEIEIIDGFTGMENCRKTIGRTKTDELDADLISDMIKRDGFIELTVKKSG